MEVLVQPDVLRYICSEGKTPVPEMVRLRVKRVSDCVIVTLNGIKLAVYDNQKVVVLQCLFCSVEIGAYQGRWTSAYTFDMYFVINNPTDLKNLPVGLSVDVEAHNAFANDRVCVPVVQCCGIVVAKNCVRLLFSPDMSIKAIIRNPNFAVDTSHETTTEMRGVLLPRLPFTPNKCKATMTINRDQERAVEQHLQLLIGENGPWRNCFTALQPTSTTEALAMPLQEVQH